MLKRLSKNVRIRQEIFKKLRNIRRKEKYLRFENENENENSQFFKIAQRKGAQPPSTSVAAGIQIPINGQFYFLIYFNYFFDPV